MNSDIKDFDIDSSQDKKCDSVNVSKIISKKKIFIAATSLGLLFSFLAIYSYEVLDSLESGGIAAYYIGKNIVKSTYPIFAMSAIIVVICLRGIDGWSLDPLNIFKRIIIGLMIPIIGVSLGVLTQLAEVSYKESRRKAAERLVTIGESLKAEQALKNYIIEYPDDPYGMIDLGVVYWNNGKRDKSLVVFQGFEKEFCSRKTLKMGQYCDNKIQSIALKELEKFNLFLQKCETPNSFYEDTTQLKILCGIRPLAYNSEINGEEIPNWMSENSFDIWRKSCVLRSFASWLKTKDNKDAIQSAFQLDYNVKTLKEFRVVAVSWASACRSNNLIEASREAYQFVSDIDERYEIEMKNSEKK